MFWLKLCFDCNEDNADQLAEQLTAVGAESVCLQDKAAQPIYELAPAEISLWQQTRVTALFPAQADIAKILAKLRQCVANLPHHHWETLADKQWERQWLRYFRPMQFGRRVWICPGLHDPPEPSAINIRLDPGLAFGTGTHATTRLCLEWLDKHLKEASHVIDYGCGSGILAVTAAKLGARHVWAVDHDPQALLASRQNAAHNQVTHTITAMEPEDLPDLAVDVVIANILLGPLIELAPTLSKRLKKGGQLVLSGITKEQINLLIPAYANQFDFQVPRILDGWVCLWGRSVAKRWRQS